MRKVGLALGALVVLALILLAGLDRHGFGLLGLRLDWNPAGAVLERLATSFLEDLQYKDFDAAAEYHAFEDRARANIPRLIERTFKVKPELMNLRDIRVTDVDFDTGGSRARTFFSANVELLNSARDPKEDENETRAVEGVLYWHLRPAADGVAPPGEGGPESPPSGEQWFMMLESSLR